MVGRKWVEYICRVVMVVGGGALTWPAVRSGGWRGCPNGTGIAREDREISILSSQSLSGAQRIWFERKVGDAGVCLDAVLTTATNGPVSGFSVGRDAALFFRAAMPRGKKIYPHRTIKVPVPRGHSPCVDQSYLRTHLL